MAASAVEAYNNGPLTETAASVLGHPLTSFLAQLCPQDAKS